MEKQTTDLLNVIKTGHSGSIAGNPAHALDAQIPDFNPGFAGLNNRRVLVSS
ncbi:TPA: hypothetical protein ACP2IH_004564 [Escherichia coli]